MKKVIAATGFLVLVLGGAVLALPAVLGSDSLRGALSRQLSAMAGAEIALTGPVRFSVFPDFGIVAEDLSYMSGDGAISIAAGRAVASVRLASESEELLLWEQLARLQPWAFFLRPAVPRARMAADPVVDPSRLSPAGDFLHHQ